MKKVVLAYSGGLDTSVILKWLVLQGYEVIAYVADVGQEEDFDQVKQKALQVGATKVYIEDLKQVFVEKYILKALKAQAIYEGRYLLGTALARPLIAKALINCAEKNKAQYIAHGATGKGNDQIRFELAVKAINPKLTIIAPWRMPVFLEQFQGREELMTFAKQEKIPISCSPKKPYSMDENLMHISFEGGSLEDPAQTADEQMYQKTLSLKNAAETPLKITLTFEKGFPTRLTHLDKEITEPLAIFQTLNQLGKEHGIGRIDIVENRFLGIKSRGVYETPGGTILFKAHHDLECLTLDREVLHLKQGLSPQIAKLIYNGLWFSPEMDFLMHAIEFSQKQVTGKVTLELYKGNVTVLNRFSQTSAYQIDLASMNESASFDQQDATGLINCVSLRLRV